MIYIWSSSVFRKLRSREKESDFERDIFLSRPTSTEAPGMPPVGGVPMGMPMGAPVVQGRGATSSQSFGKMIYPGISW